MTVADYSMGGAWRKINAAAEADSEKSHPYHFNLQPVRNGRRGDQRAGVVSEQG